MLAVSKRKKSKVLLEILGIQPSRSSYCLTEIGLGVTQSRHLFDDGSQCRNSVSAGIGRVGIGQGRQVPFGYYWHSRTDSCRCRLDEHTLMNTLVGVLKSFA